MTNSTSKNILSHKWITAFQALTANTLIFSMGFTHGYWVTALQALIAAVIIYRSMGYTHG